MPHILIIMTPARRCEALLEQAIEAAAQTANTGNGQGRVTVVWLMDEDRREHLRDCLESRGFVGVGPAKDVARLMRETAVEEGTQQLEEVQRRAVGKALAVTTELVEGHLEETVLRLVREHQPDAVYLPVGKLNPLVRLFGESAVRRLKRRLGDVLVTA